MAATLIPALCLGLLELGLRIGGYGYDSGFFLPVEGREAELTANPAFSWRFFPPAIARMPGSFSIPAEKPSGTCRIFVLGGSAAMGDPAPAFGFSRILEVMLREQFPDARFEVVNVAMVAINSHVVLRIAEACAERGADYFVVYMGNNEVVGPFGVGTVFGRFSPSLRLIRANIALSGSRIGQLVHALAAGLRGNGDDSVHWKGLEFFLDRRIAADDPNLTDMYAHFRQNLSDVCRTANEHGAEVLLCTVAVNLRDAPPFASRHGPPLTDRQREQWEQHYDTGVALESSGDYRAAADAFEAALQLDDRFAELHYRLGRCQLALNEPAPAAEHLSLARDLDVLRFRADVRINQEIREVASGSGASVHLVDVEQLFQAGGRIPGGDLFYDHCHMTFQGNHLIAGAIFERIAAEIGGPLSSARDAGTIPSMGECAKWLAFSGLDQFKINQHVLSVLQRPPFTNQIDHQERSQALRAQLAAQGAYLTPQVLKGYRKPYQAAVDEAPEDLVLRRSFASLLYEIGAYADAERHLQRVVKQWPFDARVHVELGRVLVARGGLDRGISHYQTAIASPYCDVGSKAVAHYNLANALERRDRLDEAVIHYKESLRYTPGYAKAQVNLGRILRDRGDVDDAIAHFRDATKNDPSLVAGHVNLALALIGESRWEETVAACQEWLRLQEDNPAALLALGEALLQLRRYEEAAHRFQQVLSHTPDSAEAHAGLGRALLQAGQTDSAILHLQKALELTPGDAEIEALLKTAQARRLTSP